MILASLERLTKAGIEIRHQTGSFDLERVLAGYRAHGVDASGVTPFIEDVAAAYQWADLVLCRAGATSVAELASSRKTRRARALPLCDSRSSDIQRSGYG